MNLVGWKYILTFGYSLDIYSKGNKRAGIERDTDEVIIEYEVYNGGEKKITKLN